MYGIEYYPQNEFDDDMEDKNENDKIRVRASVPIFDIHDLTSYCKGLNHFN